MKYYYNTINTESGRRVSASLRVHLFNHSVSRRLLRMLLLQITSYFFVVFPSHLLPSPCFSPSYSSSRNSDFFLPSSTRAELHLPTLSGGRAGHTTILYDFFPDFFCVIFLQQLCCCQYYGAVGTTPYGKRLISRTKPAKPLQSVLEE